MNTNKTDIDDAQFSGNELEDPDNDMQFSGNELEEPNNDVHITEKKPDRPDSTARKTISAEQSEDYDESTPVEKGQKLKWLKKLTIVHKISGMAVLVCLMATIAYFIFSGEPEVKDTPLKAEDKPVMIKKRSLTMEPFIIPFNDNKYYTYILVEISFDVTENKLLSEMSDKQNQLRKIIYDALLSVIENAQSVPPAADIKNTIKSGINPVLENGKIHEVFLTKYHAV